MTTGPLKIPGYDVLRQLGAGGVSTVYLAKQRSTGQKLAIKILHRAVDSANSEIKLLERRLLLEGRTMAKLPHRNIVTVYDIVSEDDLSYIAMEYLSAGALVDRIQNGLTLAEVVSVIVQIGAALDFAHSHGVVHRDLKPANVLFRDPLTPVLTDFGIVRLVDTAHTKLTQAGTVVGTPTYMSPEQIDSQEVDGRSDLYSLGVLFYELLVGYPPYSGDSPVVILMAHLKQPVPVLPAPFAVFQPILERMLAKDPEQRFATAKEFIGTLRAQFVNSKALAQRLQSNASAPLLEQLRGMGFLSSRAMMNNPPATTASDRPQPSQIGVARPLSLSQPAGVPQSGARWRWLALFIIALLIGVIAWRLLFKP